MKHQGLQFWRRHGWFTHMAIDIGAVLRSGFQHLGKAGKVSKSGIFHLRPTNCMKYEDIDQKRRFQQSQLVGGLDHFLFSHMLGMSSSQLTSSIIFQMGWLKPPSSQELDIQWRYEPLNWWIFNAKLGDWGARVRSRVKWNSIRSYQIISDPSGLLQPTTGKW